MFTIEEKIRYSETAHTGLLNLYGIVNHFQDCCTMHSESIGYSVERHWKEGTAWILNSWQIVVERYPKGHEEILVTTWPTGFERFIGTRNFTMKTKDGELLAYANSIWSLMDTKKMRPTRPDAEMIAAYGMEAPLDMEYAPRKIKVPEEWQEMEAFPVRRSFIDTNGHMNNGKYVEAALEYVEDPEKIRQMRVEYRASAMQGDVIYPKISAEGDKFYVNLCSEEGRTFAAVEFLLDGEL